MMESRDLGQCKFCGNDMIRGQKGSSLRGHPFVFRVVLRKSEILAAVPAVFLLTIISFLCFWLL